jgi:hypothetical protein
MKASIALLSLSIALSGCATLNSSQGGRQTLDAAPAFAPDVAAMPTPPPTPDLSPRPFVSVLDGQLGIGVQIAPNVFLPVTGGGPVTGVPTTP